VVEPLADNFIKRFHDDRTAALNCDDIDVSDFYLGKVFILGFYVGVFGWYLLKVCVIGLGLMGSALAKRLKSVGFDVVVYNRTLDKAKRFAEELGVGFAESPGKCCREADVSVLFVADDEALIDVVFMSGGIAGEVRGKDVVNMSTVSTAISTRVSRVVYGGGGRYVEVPVWGSVSEVLEGKLIAMVASDTELSDNVKKFLSVVAQRTIFVGEVPKAMVLKLALNQLNMVIVATLSETLPFLKIYGVDFKFFEELVKGSWIEPIVSRFLKRAVEEHLPRFRVELAAKDLQCFIESARIKKLDTPITAAAMQRYLEAVLHGYGDKDYPNVAKYILDTIEKMRM
jgi:3-hydroxyisobutyrate dehydrogenase